MALRDDEVTWGPTWLPRKEQPWLRLVREADQLVACEDKVRLATLDLVSGRLTIDLNAISRLDQLEQATHALAGHPDTLAARRGWVGPGTGRLWLLDRNALLAALTDRLGHVDPAVAPKGAVAVVDIDDLQRINDTFGPGVGDQVIDGVVERLQLVVGDALIGRVGGDEFVILFDESVYDAAFALAEASCEVTGPLATGAGRIEVTFSAGVTELYGDSADQVISRADATLYQAKRAGRNQILIYGEGTSGFLGDRRDLDGTVQELQARNEELAQQANTDALTGLPNRRAMDQAFEQQDQVRADSAQVDWVLFLDLDRFSAFNHTRGQEAGDDALRTVAELLRRHLRDGDTCYRRGGEEFVVVLPGTGRVAAQVVAERLRAAVEEARVPHGGHPDSPTLTITVVASSIRTRAAEAVERAARVAFDGKVSGVRNVVLTVDDEA